MRARTTLCQLLTITTLTGLAACGGGAADQVVVEATPAAVAAAGQATVAAETARFEVLMTMDLGGFGFDGAIEMEGEGVVDFAGQRSLLEVDMGSMFDALLEDVPASEMPPGAEAMFEGSMRSIQDGSVSYTCASFFRMIIDSECLRMDLEELTGVNADELPGASLTADPEALLQSLGGAGDVEEVGEEQVMGVTATHLRGTFSISDAMAALPGDDADRMRESYERLGLGASLLDAEQAFDIWVDEAGLVRQMRMTMDFGALAGADAPGVTVEMRYVEFGVPVELDIPEDAVDFTEFMELTGG